MSGFTPTIPVAIVNAAEFRVTNVSFSYDGNGNVTSVTSSFGSFDANGNAILSSPHLVTQTEAAFETALGVAPGTVLNKLHTLCKNDLGVAGTVNP